MKRIISLRCAALMLLFQLGAMNGQAQTQAEDVSEDKTIHRTANFNLGLVGGGAQATTIEALYRSSSDTYVMWFDDKKSDSITMAAPLDLRYFRTKVNAKFNSAYEHTGADVKTLTEQSIQGMFYLLYGMKGSLDDDPPPAGDLYLHRYVMVFKDVDEAEDMEIDKREKTLGQVDDAMSVFRNRANAADSAVVKEIADQVKEIREKTIPQTQKDIDNNAMAAQKQANIKKDTALVHIAGHLESITRNFRNADYNIAKGVGAVTVAMAETSTGVTDNTSNYTTLLQAYQTSIGDLHQEGRKFQSEKIFSIRHITFKVERGFLEDIHVEVENDYGSTDWYDNVIPIGMSSMANLKNFGRQRLFIRKPTGEYNNCIYLADVIGNYDLWEELLTRDYAPGDTALNRIDPNRYPYITMKRERFVHLFDSRIYTDLAGLDDKAPNGLVQIEISRRFNFLTNRLQYGGKRGDWGALNYIYLYGAITKIEDKLKRLPLRNALAVQNNTIVSPNYVTNLSLRQWENASLGLDVNALLNNWKDGKTIFSLDLGVRYGRTPIIDSLQRLDATGQLSYPTINDDLRLTAHTVTWFPRLKLEFISQRRVGFSLAYQWNNTILFSNNQFKQVTSARKSDLTTLATEGQARRSHQIDLDVRWLTSRKSDDHLFFRGRFYFQQGDASTFFPQFQLGYNYNVVFKR